MYQDMLQIYVHKDNRIRTRYRLSMASPSDPIIDVITSFDNVDASSVKANRNGKSTPMEQRKKPFILARRLYAPLSL